VIVAEASRRYSLGGSRVPIRTLADVEAFHFQRVGNPDIMIWDLHGRMSATVAPFSLNSKSAFR